jgi:hypothetical protein
LENINNEVIALQNVRVRSAKAICLTIDYGVDLSAIARQRNLHLTYSTTSRDFAVVQVDDLIYDRFMETENGLIGFKNEEPFFLDDQILENTPVALNIPTTVQKIMVDNLGSLIVNKTNAEVVFTP